LRRRRRAGPRCRRRRPARPGATSAEAADEALDQLEHGDARTRRLPEGPGQAVRLVQRNQEAESQAAVGVLETQDGGLVAAVVGQAPHHHADHERLQPGTVATAVPPTTPYVPTLPALADRRIENSFSAGCPNREG